MDLCLTPNWMVIPKFAAGIYHHLAGNGLGHPIEFYSSLELVYRFKDRSRLGISFGHISNGSLGGYNPGTEPIFLTYTVPLEYLLCHFRTD
jgi:lipid A 3-O-deacylase